MYVCMYVSNTVRWYCWTFFG